MLADQRRAGDPARRRLELGGEPGRQVLAELGVRHPEQHRAGGGLRMVEHFLDGEDRARRDALAIEQLDPMHGGMRGERAIYFQGQRGAIFQPPPAAAESPVGGEFRPSNGDDQLLPHRLVAACEVERPIGGLEDAVRRQQRMMIAGGRGSLAGFEINSRRPGQDADDGFEQRSLDALAAAVAMARLECEQDALRRKNSGEQIADGDADAGRPAFDGSGHAHQARHPLRDLIEAREIAQRPGRTEARDGAGDDARVAQRERFVVKPERLHDAGAEVVDDHVGGVDHAGQDFAPLGFFDGDS